MGVQANTIRFILFKIYYDIFHTDCGVGYYEYLLRCKICPYPSFGTDCQSICNCQNETCNHITGCQEQIPSEGRIICHGGYLF